MIPTEQRARALVASLPASVREHATWILDAAPVVYLTREQAEAELVRTIAKLRRRNPRLELLDLERAQAGDPRDPVVRDRIARITAYLRARDREDGPDPMDRAWLERERNPPARRPRRTM